MKTRSPRRTLPRAAAAVLALVLALGSIATASASPAQANAVPSGHFTISWAIHDSLPGYYPTSITLAFRALDTVAPTGDVTLTMGDTTITEAINATTDPLNSTVTFVLDGLTPGDHTMEFAYLGDSTYSARPVLSHRVSVSKISAHMKLTADPPVPGEDFVMTATVTSVAPAGSQTGADSTPTGIVELTVGTRKYAIILTPSGRPGVAVATLTLSDLAPGAVYVVGIYRGSDIHHGISDGARFDPAPAPAPRPVTVSLTAAVVGSALELSANVAERGTVSRAAGAPDRGVMEFFANGVSLGTGPVSGGAAALSTADLPAGDYDVSAHYSDVSGVYADSDSATQRVTITSPEPTTDPTPEPTTAPTTVPTPESSAAPTAAPMPSVSAEPTSPTSTEPTSTEPTSAPEPTPSVTPTAAGKDAKTAAAAPSQSEPAALATTGGNGLGLGLLAIAGALLIAGTVLRRRRA